MQERLPLLRWMELSTALMTVEVTKAEQIKIKKRVSTRPLPEMIRLRLLYVLKRRKHLTPPPQ